ncbi:hypothetical protein [Glycomyces tenuis]|uniref:hypothetical protein n=1 Tax=Glycomyces tenuis TaxID=58116 RepID=UPI00041AAAF7|nr:hypothetical protein [Glycomyces tenuis]
MSEPPEELFRRWVHIEEEDAGEVRVYVPFEDPAALGRGRDSIEFQPDGSVTRYEFSATDAPVAVEGRWRCPRAGEIRTSGPSGELELSYRIVSVDAERLRMRPMDD